MKSTLYTRGLTPEQRFMANMARIFERHYKDLLSESIKRGIAAKKLNKK
jgi:DNA invertase Pin-like site-specific DNA recombinase